MTGLWFGGGDQARVLNSLFTYNGDVRLESDVMVAIRTLYESGTAVVGGRGVSRIYGSRDKPQFCPLPYSQYGKV